MKNNTHIKKSLAQIEDLATTGHRKLAVAFCEKEMRRFPQSVSHALAYLSLLPSSGKSINAISLAIRSCLASFPDYPDLHLIAAEDYMSVGDYKSAICHAQSALALDGNNWEGHMIIGQCHLALGDSEQYKMLIYELGNSHYVIEADRLIALLETLRLLKEDKQTEARNYILDNAHICWSENRLLQHLANMNSEKTSHSKLWTLKITVGEECGSGLIFMMMAPRYGTFKVIADTLEEALGFVSELFRSSPISESNVIDCETSTCFPRNWQNKGVRCVYPFSSLPTSKEVETEYFI